MALFHRPTRKTLSSLGAVHTVFGVVTMLAGAAVLVLRKGTRLHRTLGHLYFTSLLGLNASALFIYRLFGGFGPFHVLSIISLTTIIGGIIPVVARRPAHVWMDLHAHFMAWSYVGLLAAAVSEVTTRIPGWAFGIAVIIPSAVIIGLRGVLLH